MRLKSLMAAVALGVGLAGTGLAAAEATTATPTPPAAPGHPKRSHPGDKPSKPGELPPAAPPGNAIPKMPTYTG
ncbi:hypothetical protein [Actinomadura rugatobispora]|uniref:Uncharacterized protein n=1 Tax=Actinomadura rugatobispora TaxID=1994 RepID=A0ABW0ZQM8_9ACTN|nr:hypothetical protein GCM10010200_034510 [Actinomadura rugatobispora]